MSGTCPRSRRFANWRFTCQVQDDQEKSGAPSSPKHKPMALVQCFQSTPEADMALASPFGASGHICSLIFPPRLAAAWGEEVEGDGQRLEWHSGSKKEGFHNSSGLTNLRSCIRFNESHRAVAENWARLEGCLLLEVEQKRRLHQASQVRNLLLEASA